MALLIYLLQVVDNLQAMVVVLTVLLGIGILFYSIFTAMEMEDETTEKYKKAMKKWGPVFVLFLLLSVLVPNSKTLGAMYLLPKIANSEQVNQLPEKTLKILNLKLDSYIEELAGTEKKDK